MHKNYTMRKKHFPDRQAHQHRHRPPPQHHPGGGFDPVDGPRPDRRARPAQRTVGAGRPVCPAVQHLIQLAGLGIFFYSDSDCKRIKNKYKARRMCLVLVLPLRTDPPQLDDENQRGWVCKEFRNLKDFGILRCLGEKVRFIYRLNYQVG